MTFVANSWTVILYMSNLFHNNKDSSGNIFDGWSYDIENYILFGVGIITIILGYIIMASGDTYSFQSLSLTNSIIYRLYHPGSNCSFI